MRQARANALLSLTADRGLPMETLCGVLPGLPRGPRGVRLWAQPSTLDMPHVSTRHAGGILNRRAFSIGDKYGPPPIMFEASALQKSMHSRPLTLDTSDPTITILGTMVVWIIDAIGATDTITGTTGPYSWAS